MDASPVLRQQSQNTVRTDILRTKSEQNKMAADTKSPKVLSTLHPLQHNLENHDPGSSGLARPAPVRPGVSRLPVLAKSLHLQTPNDFTQSHCKWEAKPLAGKAKTKKPCTRPVPFNLSQPKATRVVSENQQLNTVHQTRTSKPDRKVCSSHHKTTNRNLQHLATLKDNVKSTKSAENTSKLLGQSSHLHPHKTSAQVSKPVSSASNTLGANASASEQSASCAEACSENMNLLSLKDSSKISKGSYDKVDNFQHDHAALLSILHNKGVSSTMTPQSKPYNYLPQRVSVMKSRQNAEPNTGSIKSVQFSPDHVALQSILQNEGVKAGGPSDRTTSVFTPMRVPLKKNGAEPSTGPVGAVKTVQFSPDAAALQSILQNEGVKAGDPVGATTQNSVYPTGRGTSIYMAQRVPVRKNLAEPNGGTEVASLKQTPGQKWTPQRVARHQPMSAMKWHMSSQQSPYAITPGLRGCKANLCPKQEVVVQRLFDDENEQKEAEPQTESPSDQTSASQCKEGMQRTVAIAEEEEGKINKDEQVVRPFIQAPERESVIFFSTGKKLFRDPRFKKTEAIDNKEQQEALPVLKQSWEINTTVQTKDLLTQKSAVINPVVAMLRKRLPSLEELRLDEEVATYTSVSVPTVSGFHSPRPRCGNPLATMLHFEESTRFVPISFDMSPDSPHER